MEVFFVVLGAIDFLLFGFGLGMFIGERRFKQKLMKNILKNIFNNTKYYDLFKYDSFTFNVDDMENNKKKERK